MTVASVAGTIVESYDFALFGLGAALVFGGRFFPAGSPGVATLASLATFAVGFLARPIGGLVLSHFGDRAGRVPIMVFTLSLMGSATIGIGLLPSYESVGILAPVLLVILRLLQGIGAGAEYVGAILVATESGGHRGRGLRASLPAAGFFGGVLLATLAFSAVSLLPERQFVAWGWRVPFLLSLVTVLIGLYFRVRISETTAFSDTRTTRRANRFPVWEVIRRQPRDMFLVFAANGPFVGIFYLAQVFLLSYATKSLGVSAVTGLVANLVASAVAIVTVPLFGVLTDRVGRRPVWFGGSAFLIITAFPMFRLVESGGGAWVVMAVTLMVGVGVAAMVAAQSALFPELFETSGRFSGVTVAREASAALVGGPAPFVAAALTQRYGGASWPIALLITVLGVVAFVAVVFLRETRRISGISEADS
ncbi:MFS transporter [Streptosporangium sp. NPDC000396]|uniref:MFS transporter n=1 Tax=Streptosporangium sp. NPDC000396 TaxID=3366185 RepID=UPI003679E853